MPHSGDISTTVAVVAADDAVRDAAVAALEADTSLAVSTPNGEGEEAARAGVERGAVCVVCGPDEAYYGAVREADPARPVVVVDPGGDRIAGDLLDRVLEDPAAAYVADDEHTSRLVRSRVRDFVERERDEVGWHLADLSGEAIVSFDLDTYGLREANETFFDNWALDPQAIGDATLADLRETDITHELRGRGRGEPGEEDLEWLRDGGSVETFVEGALNGDFERREWHCTGVDGAFKSEVEIVADRSAGIGYLVATVPDDDGPGGIDDDYDEGAMLRSLVEHVPMSVYFKDDRSRHVLVSEDVVEPFIESPEGKILQTPEDVHGKTDFDLYEASHAEAAVADDRQVVESGEPIRGRIERASPPNGRDLFFQTTKAPWYDDSGRLRGTVGVTVDVTEQKHRERELDRQNERLEEFASIISHDLRNPLNVAGGRLERYRQTGDESDLDAVAEMHERMASIIDDVLSLARDGGKIEETERTDASAVATRAWSTVDTGTATLEQDWAYAIEADPDRLARLFENVFRNAIEHGGADVTVRVGTLDDEPGFYVADDGPGIAIEPPERVFERGVSATEDGTGFGLAIVREIAEAHRWSVAAVADENASGARFEFTGVTRAE
ncbi:sensor histidine kinase [Halosimplex aquaticum]|uniref:histidine kinase n=1 Tax=Halosimplex aquaticum TaxID=3026162 RepID=A0ABD5Y4W8_9EURY|nr:PAS domain-containing sensor histidine kinase [Halosimplex aquaticum]